MPYENEFASYRPLQRIADSEAITSLLARARVHHHTGGGPVAAPVAPPSDASPLPDWVVAIDGSAAEVPVLNGYPGANVGYCTVASVLLNLDLIGKLDGHRPINPVEFRKTEKSSTLDAALPGSNVVIRDHISARDSFRDSLHEFLENEIFDEDDPIPLLATYEELLKRKPGNRNPRCPYDYDGCDQSFPIGPGMGSCLCPRRRAIYSTDALRIHERFREEGSNGEALGEVMQVWERLLLIHILRCFERRGWLSHLSRLAFVMDGPLALFGHPAWLSAAISGELKRLNLAVRKETGQDLLLLGIEKTGTFVDHFEQIDETETPGEKLFPDPSCFLPDDDYIKRRIIYSTSTKRYGQDTYFGRKLFYKTSNGARIVANIPFLSAEQDTLESSDFGLYPQLGRSCTLLDKLVSARYPNALAPIVSAHAEAAIPLNLGAKVLQQLAQALVKGE